MASAQWPHKRYLKVGCIDTLKATEANRRRGPGTRELLDQKELT
jgi:molybdate-binding protein